MTLGLAAVASVLFATGVYLVFQRTLTRILLGIGLIGHAANLLLLISGGRAGEPPFAGADVSTITDPLPQALALTSIVITFGTTAFLLALAFRSVVQRGDDDVEDDAEDRRIARLRHFSDEDAAESEADSDDGVVLHGSTGTEEAT